MFFFFDDFPILSKHHRVRISSSIDRIVSDLPIDFPIQILAPSISRNQLHFRSYTKEMWVVDQPECPISQSLKRQNLYGRESLPARRR